MISVFKTGVSSDPAQAGSIPVRLREPGWVRTVGTTRYGWMHVRGSTRICSRTARALRRSGRRGCSRARVSWRFVECAAADADGQQVDDDPELAHGRGVREGVSDDLCLGNEVPDERAEQVADAAADEHPAEWA